MNSKYLILQPEKLKGMLNGINEIKIDDCDEVCLPIQYYQAIKYCKSFFIYDSAGIEKQNYTDSEIKKNQIYNI